MLAHDDANIMSLSSVFNALFAKMKKVFLFFCFSLHFFECAVSASGMMKELQRVLEYQNIEISKAE